MKSILSHSQFNKQVQSGRPFVLDFYADWCGPCQTLLPTVAKLASEFEQDVDIYKVNVDQQSALAEKFNVRSIPALFFMESNTVKDTVRGVASEASLRKKIKALI